MRHDPFNRARIPGDFSRPGRVALLKEVAESLIAGRQPSSEAALFVGSSIQKWLAEGGNLERDFLKVKAARGSHRTPAQIAATLHRDEGEPR